ncbi:MAG: matrixin family metalloprotease [Actinomycetota bacterium]
MSGVRAISVIAVVVGLALMSPVAAAGGGVIGVSVRIGSTTSDWVAQGDADGAGPIGGAALGPGARWPLGTRVRFVINPAGAPEGAIDAVRSAVATWRATGVDVRIDYGGVTDRSGSEADLINVVSWVDLPEEPFVARTTTYWFEDSPAELIGFDLVFNSRHAFAVGAGVGDDAAAWDTETIALHEFGHVLGLGHADPERVLQVMRPRIGAGEVDHTLSRRDVAALDALYGIAAGTDGRGPDRGLFGSRQVGRPRFGQDGLTIARPPEPGLFD